MPTPLIALLTDFGEEGHFVASLKAVIAGLHPEARVVDISHRVPAFDIRAAGFILFACARVFPAGTIFVAVVDPGVGTARRLLLVRTARHWFIAPDNGLLTLTLDAEPAEEVRELAASRFFLSERSTFEARDKMAPAAAWLSLGIPAAEFGPVVTSWRKLPVARPRLTGKKITGEVVHADRFGNLITNIPEALLWHVERAAGPAGCRLKIGRRPPLPPAAAYAVAPRGRPVFLIGSLGLVEIAVREGSAARLLRAGAGTRVEVAPRRTR
jgi:S-adenosyl-L-methionine hydrolase (adenosine-forming)